MADLVPTNYYFGHGEGWAGLRTAAGAVSNFDVALPEINSAKITITAEDIEHVSKRQAVAGKDLKVTHMLALTGELNVSVHTKEMLALYLYGNSGAISGGSFSNAAFPSGIVATNVLPIPGGRTNVSSLVITDSAGSPATLTPGTNYSVDLNNGVVTFIDVTGFTQPFKAAGTEAPSEGVGLLTTRVQERYLRLGLINVADGDKRCSLDLYRVFFGPANEWQLLNDGTEVNSYVIPFEALKDTAVDPAATWGQFGRYRQVT